MWLFFFFACPEQPYLCHLKNNEYTKNNKRTCKMAEAECPRNKDKASVACEQNMEKYIYRCEIISCNCNL